MTYSCLFYSINDIIQNGIFKNYLETTQKSKLNSWQWAGRE